MKPRLVVLSGEEKGLTLPLQAGCPVTIGRDRGCTLVLRDEYCSRRQAEIRPEGEQWVIEDLGSKTGTYVNGVRVSSAVLQDGQEIRIGKVHLLFAAKPISDDRITPVGSDPAHSPSPPTAGPVDPAAPDLAPGDRVGKYTILGFIGRGGMAHVYKAKHETLKRIDAIKLLPKKYSVATMRELFAREMEATGLLSHPGILRAYDAGEHNGQFYLAIEFVNGSDLGDLVRRQGALPPTVAADYLIQAAQGLSHAHDRGIVHRDVKPSNLILNEAGRIQVLDFGLACFRNSLLPPKNYCLETDPLPELSVLYGEHDDEGSFASIFAPKQGPGEVTLLQGLLVGTPAYMSPEQTYPNEVDRRSDIYSLGCTFFFLVTGRPMYREATIPQVLGAHRSQPIPSLPEIVPASLNAIFQRMVAKRPEDRFQSMAEVIVELQAALADLADKPLLFLCYRREDSFDATHRLYEQLAARFGEKSVVMDIDTIPPGEDFRAFLEKAVTRCAVMLAVIGDHWVKIRDDEGRRRLDQRMDYVRFEIATALDQKKPVVPVLVGQASMPKADDLPRELRDLAFLQAAELRSARGYQDQVARLTQRLEEVFRTKS